MNALGPWLNKINTYLRWPFQKKPDIHANPLLAPIEEQLVFVSSQHLSVGIELELGLVNPETLLPMNCARDVLESLDSERFHQEPAAHILEVTTGICTNVKQAEDELAARIREARTAAENICHARLCGTGRLTLLKTADAQLYDSDRYTLLQERRQVLHRRFNSMQGMHMHLGMRNAEECVRYHNFFTHFLPHILAISASTPVDDSGVTGLACARPIAGESLPIAGLPYHFNTWDEYQALCKTLAQTDSISSLKDLYWDLRPSPRLGTLEIRTPDQPATLAEAMALAAFIHCLALWFEEHSSWINEMPRPNTWRMRDNKWRVMRYGLDAQLITSNRGDTHGLKTDIALWLKRLEDIIARQGYQPQIEVLQQVLQRGNSSQRQQAILRATGDLKAVAAFNLREWENGAPLWDEAERLAGPSLPAAARP
ncbi:MAG: YbdK family carboxylate-amine ligase [Bdellovibrionales bacterium]